MAGSLALLGVALAPSAGATSNVTATRIAGPTRYGTAGAIAGNSAFGTPAGVIVATGENFPDALAASALAGSKAPAPIVLTQKDTFTSDAKAALDALKTKGVTSASLVGGTSAVSDSVKSAIEADGFTVTRIAGTNRYGTASAIGSAAGTAGSIGGNKTALIATGENFPDALAGGPASYAGRLPILLVTANSVPSETSGAIANLGIKHAVILGGTVAVSDSVKSQLDTMTGTASERIAGTNRYGTAAAVADWEKANLGFPMSAVVAATGNNFPDALASGPLGGQLKAPIVLTASCPAETTAELQKFASTIAQILVTGGTSAVDDATIGCLKTAAGGSATSGAGVTARPELLSSKVLSTSAVGANPGTVIQYTFDEALTGAFPAGAGAFKLYRFDDTRPALTATNVAIDPSDNKSVDATFATLTTPASLTPFSVAAVAAGAVTQLSGGINATNPEGDAALQGTSAATNNAGTTAAPDLVSVGNFRASGTGTTLVDFTFDQAAYNVVGTGYHLVTVSGSSSAGTSDIGCTQIPAPAGVTTFGDGTTVQTVQCTNSAVTGPMTATNIARGYVLAGTVQSSATGGTTNPLEAADVGNGGNNTNNPNLVSATFDTAATYASASGPVAVDTVLYTFDRPVLLAGPTIPPSFSSGSLFNVYKSDGTTINGATTDEFTPATSGKDDAERSTSNDTQVLVYFADGALNNAVGASVAPVAVNSASNGSPNDPDEVAVAPPTASGTVGTTDGPDLKGVLLLQTKDAFGTVTGITATYIFDENLVSAAPPAAGNFKLWGADGSGPFTCTTMPASLVAPSAGPSTATCAGWAGATSNDQLFAATLGTVAADQVTGASSGKLNPEGANPTAGGNGTPQA